jgi:hypothetical protein
LSKIIFGGCSITSGRGLNRESIDSDDKDNLNLWVNLCHKNIPEFRDLTLLNISVGGSSNQKIFNTVIEAISKNDDIEYIVCAWTSVPRYNFNIGFELYDTENGFYPNEHPNEPRIRNHKLNQGNFTDGYLRKLSTRFLTLHDLHYEIVHLLKFINIITNLTRHKGTKIINVNAICPWDDQFFKMLPDNCKPSDYTKFTQNLLNVHNKDDDEILKLYHKQHEQYNSYGGIREHTWVNLYNSFLDERIDTNYDELHPGVESNQRYFQLVQQYMQTLANKDKNA